MLSSLRDLRIFSCIILLHATALMAQSAHLEDGNRPKEKIHCHEQDMSSSACTPLYHTFNSIKEFLPDRTRKECFEYKFDGVNCKIKNHLYDPVSHLEAEQITCKCIKDNNKIVSVQKVNNAGWVPDLNARMKLDREFHANEISEILGPENKSAKSLAKACTVSGCDEPSTSDTTANTEIKKPEAAAKDECLSYNHHYRTYNQFPSLNSFYTDIGKSKFEAKEWDHQKLKEAYDDAVKLKDEKKKAELEAKLSFLYNNPLYLTVFDSKFQEIKGGKEKQEEVFKIFKDHLSLKEDCYPECKNKFIASEKYFLLHAEIARALAPLEEEFKKIDIQTDPDLAPTVEEINALVSKTEMLSPKVCDGRKVIDYTRCEQVFLMKYCPLVDEAVSRLEKMKPSEKHIFKIFSSTNPDQNKNRAYQNTRKALCENALVSRSNPAIKKTFEEFKEKECKEDPTCDKSDVFVSYMKRYRPEKLSDSSEAVAQIADGLPNFIENKRSPERRQAALQGLPWFEAFASSQNMKAEPTMLEKFNKGLADFTKAAQSQTSDENLDNQPFFYNSPTPSAPSQEKAEGLADDGKQSGDAQSDRTNTERELLETKRKLAKAESDLEKSQLASKVDELETRLAEKEKSEAEYRKLLKQLAEKAEKKDELQEARVAPTEITNEANTFNSPNAVASNSSSNLQNNLTNDPKSTLSSAGFNENSNAGANRGTASISSSSKKTSAEAAAINTALLAKYENVANSGDQDASAAATDKDFKGPKTLDQKTMNVRVSPEEFAKLNSDDVSSLVKGYEQKVKSVGADEVRIFVRSEGSPSPLEFLAIRTAEGKVIFRPVRKAKRADLIESLSQ